MPTERGKLTAFPTIHRGVLGYAYRVVFTRSYRSPNGERIPANFNGLEARLTIYPANKQGPPLLDLSTTAIKNVREGAHSSFPAPKGLADLLRI
ncbi:MAG: hypothetical protein KatS3mg070_1574 [Meiothermus sp.]|uniref:hypothetical protein n=1 Tax=Meiothermus sp. TaxID=1955249 RepID=UPI0021DE7874|nr:hypothetical protein [Meiothermus sp.]GIW28211.1 MAG: hypothetical protein KatS3mg070_1574 [Meiothermus sp.]